MEFQEIFCYRIDGFVEGMHQHKCNRYRDIKAKGCITTLLNMDVC